MLKNLLFSVLIIATFNACSEKKEPPKTVRSGMKCGAGKCGANMFDGNSALDKKKKNILSQMSEEDKRRSCVISALSTKEVYECVRNPETKKLSLKCGGSKAPAAKPAMKCGPGKCGGSMN
ncbi:MAG: hypothetical protein U9N39_07855 [Campylobacterota bacterium]|nr:hypothetical protein [Campylobacterota bacterium]